MADTPESDRVSEEDAKAWEQGKRDYFEKLRTATPEEVRRKLDGVSHDMQVGLMTYMLRPSADPEVLALFGELVNRMGHALSIGNMENPLTTTRLEDVKAGLIGAARVLDPSIAEGRSPEGPVGHVRLARRFIELTERNIGVIDKTTGEAEIRQRLRPNQVGATVKHTPKP